MEIKLNGKSVTANENETILDVAKREGVDIPTLCYLKELGATSNCRICLVEVKGQKNLITACSFKVFDGMEVTTNSSRVLNARKVNLELMLSNHNYDCKNCVRDKNCTLQTLANEYNADGNRFKGEKTKTIKDDSSPCIVRDNSKCILCKKCVQVCEKGQSVNAIKEVERGFNTQIGVAFNKGIKSSTCVGCGQCVMVCPTGALCENRNIKELETLLNDNTKLKIVAPAPAVRVALMEALNITNAVEAEKLLPAVLKKLGFNKVYDINFGADLTVMEESREFLNRLKTKKNLPMFTSCCPAWVDFVNKFYPEFKQNVSSCKSPLMMFGAVTKTYLAEKKEVFPSHIRVVSVMPCTAKKEECLNVNKNGTCDIDLVITVRELLYLINKKNINIKNLKPQTFDSLMGESSGAGVIFGASGGVMEAAIRTIADKLNNDSLGEIEYREAYGLKGTKFANVKIGDKTIDVAVVSGLNNAKNLLEKIKNKEIDVHFVEVMSCEGGCINGGGMPFKAQNSASLLNSRREGLYSIDKERKVRKAHENEEIKKFYEWQNLAKDKAELHTR